MKKGIAFIMALLVAGSLVAGCTTNKGGDQKTKTQSTKQGGKGGQGK
ncbi:hypothetical protein PP175_12285 [Aneurinibacillus sp. Ricciae_BoGa-3]|nr:hypothetical protein [Aneurinibacillus sp. Ricciae_BoGa-3]WCK56616.1 hypothetical protein PP175_12285 [Aneurinibacillus sp. Ricciae_BoGa-3]